MSQLWYYENHGRAMGPISTLELVGKIKSGEVKLVDLIFKEGDPQWLPAQSFSEITDELGGVTLQQSSEWIVLTSVNVDGRETQKQIGPYNAQQILDLIDKGYVRFSDYVWREGYETWVPLGYVDQFEQPLKSSVAVDKSLYTSPQRNLISEEVPLKKIPPSKSGDFFADDGDVPHEAQGEDLTIPAWVKPLRNERKEEDSEDSAVDLAPPSPEEVAMSRHKKKEKRHRQSTVYDQKSALQKMSLQDELALNKLEVNLEAPVEGVERIYSSSEDGEVDGVVSGQNESEGSDVVLDTSVMREEIRRRWGKAIVAALLVATISLVALFAQRGKMTSEDSKDFTVRIDSKNDFAEVTTPQSQGVGQKPALDTQGSVAVERGHGDLSSRASADGATAVAIAPPASPPVVPPSSTETPSSDQSGEREISRVRKGASQKTQKSSAPVREQVSTALVKKGSFKERSYYHQKERRFIFYKSAEGEKLSHDLGKMLQKNKRSHKEWKAFYAAWLKKAKEVNQGVQSQSKVAKTQKGLFLELSKLYRQLLSVGGEINHRQLASSKSVSKDAPKELAMQFRKMTLKAKNLDK